MKPASRIPAALTAAALAALTLTGCSGITLLEGAGNATEGTIGDTLSNMFFDFTVNSAAVADEYDGYTPADGSKLVVCSMTLENDFGEDLPMYDSDFQIQWVEGDEDYAWSLNPVSTDEDGMPTNSQMPLEWTMADGAVETYDIVFEVPADISDFVIVYLEQYVDQDGNEGEGQLYSVSFSV